MAEEGGAVDKWRERRGRPEVWLHRLDAVEAAAVALLKEVRALRREASEAFGELGSLEEEATALEAGGPDEANAAPAIPATPEAMPASPPLIPASSGESAPESAEARAKRIERVMHARAALFLSLFQGNPEHYAVRWEGFKDAGHRLPTAGYAPARFRDGRFKPFDEAAAIRHLTGEEVISAYPMTAGNRTPFLVIDLDGKGEASAGSEKKETAEKVWRRDARAVLAAARKAGVPAQAEISRSGEGAHIWLFFSELIPAALARRLGGALLAAAMSFEGASPELLSFDRMIPAQDELPPGRIGNLVALPLQRRRRDLGFTVFVDEALAPVENQWRFLQNIQRLSAAEAEAAESRLEALFGPALPARLPKAGRSGKALSAGRAGKSAAGGAAMEPLAQSASPSSDEAWSFSRTRLEASAPVLHLRLEATLSADESELTPPLRSALLHLASFANPAFFKAKSRGEPVWQIPRRIFAAFEREGQLHLPRGVAAKALERLRRDGIAYEIEDCRDPGRPLGASFMGTLRGEQEKAAELAARAECGILVGMTGFGKTVVGAAAAARSEASTLVLVHAQVLAEQWAAAAQAFLGLSAKEIGIWSGGKRSKRGRFDIASYQSLLRLSPEEKRGFMAGYGLLLVDECHHAAALGFADVILAFPGRRILGLTATPQREDGRGAALPMLLGPVLGRFAGASVERRILRPLSWRGEIAVPPDADYPLLLNALAEDPARLAFAADAAAALLREGRGLLVLTERVSHADALEPRLREAAPFVLRLRSAAKEKREAMAALAKFAAQGAPKPFAILATGKLAGEGFDFPPLDALLLAMPVMSERLVKQYAGRILRRLDGKDDAVIADIVDENRGIFAGMWKRRRRIYAEIGFSEEATASDLWHPAQAEPVDGRH